MRKENSLPEETQVPGGKQKNSAKFFIVGIGASSGGVKALQHFFKEVPLDAEIAYVVILHLSPDHDSELVNVLQHETQLPVIQVKEKTEIKAKSVYVVPPDHHLIMGRKYISAS